MIKLQNAYNLRDIGGYKTSDGKTVNNTIFLRSDSLSFLSDEDISSLLEYGLGSVIDLRSVDELSKYPNPFSAHNDINFTNIALIVDENSGDVQDVTKMFLNNPSESIPKLYVQMLTKSTENIKQVFEFIGNNLDKTILYHCTAGKDRTGIISMLLLGLANVSREDIIKNYTITYENNKLNPNFEEVTKLYPVEILYSTKEYITPAIDYIENNFNSYYDYLISIGVSEEILNKITEKLVN